MTERARADAIITTTMPGAVRRARFQMTMFASPPWLTRTGAVVAVLVLTTSLITRKKRAVGASVPHIALAAPIATDAVTKAGVWTCRDGAI